MGLFHGVQYRFLVPGRQGDEINYLGLNPILAQLFRGTQGIFHSDGVGHNGDISACPDHLGFANGVGLLFAQFRDLAFFLVQDFIFKIEDRVVADQGCLQNHFGVVRIRGSYHFDAGNVAEPSFHALGMLGRALVCHSVRGAEDQGCFGLTAEHVPGLGHLVEDLVHGNHDKIGKVHVHHRTGAGQGRAHTTADDKCLGNGSVNDPARELVR